MRSIKNFALFTVSVLGLAVFVGCSSTRSRTANSLTTTSPAPAVDLTRYSTVTVVPFQATSDATGDPVIGSKFAEQVANRLRDDFPTIFREVRVGNPGRQPDELLVTGTITKHQAGDKVARFFVPGASPAKFEGDVVLRDAASDQVLLTASMKKLWAFSGPVSLSKDIERMVDESAAAAANTIARAKGWHPDAVPVAR